MAFVVLLVATLLYFIRPTEFLPDLLGARVYLVCILLCLAGSVEQWSSQLAWRSLAQYPISALVLGLLALVALSGLFSAGSLDAATGFGKACVYYFLLVGIVDSERKQHAFLWGLAIILSVVAALMLLNHHGVISLDLGYSLGGDELDSQGGSQRINALGGNFADPNDTALILIPGILIALHGVFTPRPWVLRCAALGMAGVMLRAVQLTDSRGGFLALMVGLGVYCVLRWGRKGLVLGLCTLPLVAGWFATQRMAGIQSAIEEDTGQIRIQLWMEAIALLKQNPLLGVGPHAFSQYVGRAPHNTFLESYAELGLLGGTLFVGAFAYGLASMIRLARPSEAESGYHEEDVAPAAAGDPTACLVAAVLAGYAMGALALTHLFGTHTYLFLGLATVTARLHGAERQLSTSTLLMRLGAASVAFLMFSYIAGRALVRW